MQKNIDRITEKLVFIASFVEEGKDNKNRKAEDLFEYKDVAFLDKITNKLKKKTPCIEEIFGDTVFTENEIIKILGSKWIECLRNILYVVKRFGNTEYSKAISYYISTYDKYFLSNIGNPSTVSKTLKKCIDIGLIKLKDSFYCFNNGSQNRSRYYYWNSRIAKVIRNMAIKNGITVRKPKKSKIRLMKERIWNLQNRIEEKNEKKIKENMNNVYIKQFTSIDLDDDLAHYCLHKNYPFFEKYHIMMERYNDIEEFENNREVFNFNIERNKSNHIMSIAIRGTSTLCSFSHEDRDSTLDDMFGQYHWFLNDVNGSIFRVTYLLNHGVWLDRKIDMYEFICGFELDKNTRDIIKHNLMMLCYFSTSFNDAVNNLVYRSELNEVTDITQLADEKYNVFKCIFNADCDDLKKSYEYLYYRMREVLGVSYLSEIFLFESCIYILAKKKLVERGYRVVRVYDGFYTDKFLSMKEFDEVIRESALEFYDDIKEWLAERRRTVESEFEKSRIRNKNRKLKPEDIKKLEEKERLYEQTRKFWKLLSEKVENKKLKRLQKQETEITEADKNTDSRQLDEHSETFIQDNVNYIEKDKKFNIEHLNNVKTDFSDSYRFESFFSSS